MSRETEEEKIEKIKVFLSENQNLNLDNLSWVIHILQERITDLENKVFLNKDK
jgi:hypothetical protein